MDIKFIGVVSDGCGLFAKQNRLPSMVSELSHVRGWPNSIHQGTFNIKYNEVQMQNFENFNFRDLGVRWVLTS